MDFGVIYMQNKAATHAAMVLGVFVFLVFILLPMVAAYLFIPLYLIVLLMAMMGKFKDEERKYALLMPIIPFGVAIVLCLMFFWAVPAVVNFARDCLDMVMMRDDILFREPIPDSKCYLYFILVLGGGVGSMLALTSIIMPKESNVKRIDKLKRSDRKPATPPVRFVPDFNNTPSGWDDNESLDLTATAHATYRNQQYNVDKWKQRQKRKEEKRSKRS